MADASRKSSEIESKIQRLDMVFKKATDVASNSLNNADLDECFHDMKTHYGNVLPKLFMNMIAKSQVNIEAAYRDICIMRDLEEGMRNYEVSTAATSSSSSSDDAVELASAEDPLSPAILLDLKRIEADNLKEAIQQFDSEIEKLKKQTAQMREAFQHEIAAVAEVGNFVSST